MSRCDKSRQLSAYLDGELSAGERKAIEEHLASCDACALELAQLQEVSDALRNWQAPAMSPQAMRRIHQSVDALSLRRLRRVALALSSVAALLAVATVLWPSQGSAIPAEPTWARVAVAPGAAEEATTSSSSQEVAVAQWVVADLSAGANRE